MQMFPQVTQNVRVADKAAVTANAKVQAAISAVRERLGAEGRILLRESGTEPVVRVMVEAESETLCRAYVQEVAAVIYAEGLALQA